MDKKELIAKANEAMKACGKRELSLDEMDKVSGGADGAWINGVFMSEADLNSLGQYWTDQFGYDIAAHMFCELTGISKREIKDCNCGTGSDKDSMSVLVNRYMKILDNLEEKGHSW